MNSKTTAITTAKVASILGLSLILCSCTLFRPVGQGDANLPANYFGEIKLERNAPREPSDYAQMKIAADYFVEWREDVYVVPKEMRTDFASIPGRVRTVIAVLQAPDLPITQDISLADSMGIWTEPSTVHDAGYRDQLEIMFVNSENNTEGNRVILNKFKQCYVSKGGDKTNSPFNDFNDYNKLLGEGSEIVNDDARKFFLDRLNNRPSETITNDNGEKDKAVQKFLSSATVYSLHEKHRNMLGNLKTLDDCYCERRSCIQDRSTIDAMFANFLYTTGIRKWGTAVIAAAVRTFGRSAWRGPNPNGPIIRGNTD